jgi:glycosyltransferase involved in cell wall biosynthesis
VKVLYNALSTRTGGGMSYARDQVAALLARNDLDVTVYVAPWNRELWHATDVPADRFRDVNVSSVPLRVLWEQTVLPFEARRFDVVLSPGNMGPLVCPTPQVVILQNPNYAGGARRRETNRTVRRRAKIGFSHLAMRRADRVVAISASLASEMAADPRLRSLDVALVRSGSATPVDALDDDAASKRVDALIGPEPYVLSVANDYPHKRLVELGDLARRLPDVPGVPDRVVLAGSIGEATAAGIRARAGGHTDGVVLLGPVHDVDDVRALYRRSFASVSVSDLEAWPLTLLEARAEGAPLVVTDIPPHREIASGQARFFPVGSVDDLVAALVDAAGDDDRMPWHAVRTWDDHADELVEVLRTVVRDRSA